MNFHIFLQVRSNSNRLPFKCFLLFKKLPAIIYLCKKLKVFKNKLIVLTTNDKSDLFLRHCLKKYKINFFQGSSKNVKKRFLDCSSKLKDKDIIIRLTGDNILVDDKLIKKCLFFYKKQNKDYLCFDTKENNVPYGISVEIFKLKLLRDLKNSSNKINEHVTSNFKKEFFKINNFFKKKMFNFRSTLDYLEDYISLKKNYRK